MRIGFLGDVHGDSQWMKIAAYAFQQEGIEYVIQVGDFGLYPARGNGRTRYDFLGTAEEALQEAGIVLDVVPGNHENYDYIERLQEQQDGRLAVSARISVLPRGFRWEAGGKSFVALGGAPSVDRAYRLWVERQRPIEKLWWEQEAITQEDVDKVVEGGHADIMVAHDAPFSPTIENRISGNPMGFAQEDLDYALIGRARMDSAYHAVKPKMFFHGHYHFPVDDLVDFSDETTGRVIGLDMNHRKKSIAILDTDTDEVTMVNVGKYSDEYYIKKVWKKS